MTQQDTDILHHKAMTGLLLIGWFGLIAVDGYINGTTFVILGSDANMSHGFLGFAILIVGIKSLSWAKNWIDLGILSSAISIFCAVGLAVSLFAVDSQTVKIVHSDAYIETQKQIMTLNAQLAEIKEQDAPRQKIAFTQSLAVATERLVQLDQEDRSRSRLHLTTRLFFDTMFNIPKAPGAEILCIIVFTALGLLLEIGVYRITPRFPDAQRNQKIARTLRAGGYTSLPKGAHQWTTSPKPTIPQNLLSRLQQKLSKKKAAEATSATTGSIATSAIPTSST